MGVQQSGQLKCRSIDSYCGDWASKTVCPQLRIAESCLLSIVPFLSISCSFNWNTIHTWLRAGFINMIVFDFIFYFIDHCLKNTSCYCGVKIIMQKFVRNRNHEVLELIYTNYFIIISLSVFKAQTLGIQSSWNIVLWVHEITPLEPLKFLRICTSQIFFSILMPMLVSKILLFTKLWRCISNGQYNNGFGVIITMILKKKNPWIISNTVHPGSWLC